MTGLSRAVSCWCGMLRLFSWDLSAVTKPQPSWKESLGLLILTTFGPSQEWNTKTRPFFFFFFLIYICRQQQDHLHLNVLLKPEEAQGPWALNFAYEFRFGVKLVLLPQRKGEYLNSASWKALSAHFPEHAGNADGIQLLFLLQRGLCFTTGFKATTLKWLNLKFSIIQLLLQNNFLWSFC